MVICVCLDNSLPNGVMAAMKSNLLYFSSGSLRNCCYFVFRAGRSSNGRTLPSGGGYLGPNPSLPALEIK